MADSNVDAYSGVLELRIHGVNNTSPAAMLDVGVDDVEPVPHQPSDALSGFWQAKPGVLEHLVPGERGYTPPGLVREAYSWGGLARTSPNGWGLGTVKAASAAASRLAWIMLIPFGLVNLAYWSRRLADRGDAAASTATGVWSGRGAASIRVFSLAATLFAVVTACDVSLDVIARQCYGVRTVKCGQLPSQLDIFAGWSLAQRLAAGSLIPVALLLLLLAVIQQSRTRYEQKVAPHTQQEAAAMAATDQPADQLPELDYTLVGAAAVAAERVGGPQLTAPRLWSGDRLVGRALGLHIAAGLLVVTLSTSWAASIGLGPACRSIDTLQRSCWDQLTAGQLSWHQLTAGQLNFVVFGAVTGLAVLLLVLVVAVVIATADDAPDVRPGVLPARAGWLVSRLRKKWMPSLLLGLGGLVFVVEALLLAWRNPEITPGFALPGVLAIPTILVSGMLAVAMSALAWRTATQWQRRLSRATPGIVGVGFCVFLLVTRYWGWYSVGVAGICGAILFYLPRLAVPKQHPDPIPSAWRGRAPGVFLILALGALLLLSSLVTLAMGDWLNGGNSASTLIGPAGMSDAVAYRPACVLSCLSDPVLVIPTAYVWFGVMSFLALPLMALFAVVLWGPTRGGDRIPPAPGTALLKPIDPTVPWTPTLGLELARRKARRFASLTQRAELAVGWLALFDGVAAAMCVLASASNWRPLADGGWLAIYVVKFAVVGVALAGVALVGAVLGGNPTGKGRPLGLLWDLVGFLPRAGHPFGPPCYAERAVPEILMRCKNWLGTDIDTPIPGRRVVLSAHSLGSVLATATVFYFRTLESGISVLSYGSQLRAYFSRVFPELLGPDVLGVPACVGPKIHSEDPWVADIAFHGQPLGAGKDTLRARLTGTGGPAPAVAEPTPITALPRWISLWRRTDYIGFPVYSYDQAPDQAPNVIDRVADERDTTGAFIIIGTHSDYPRAPEYQQAFDELLTRP